VEPSVVCAEKTRNYVFTKKTYQPVTENSPLFAVDCEMVSIIGYAMLGAFVIFVL